jgi:hypothetical protein
MKKGGEVSDEDLQVYLDAVEKTRSLMQTDEMRSFSKIYEENDNSVIGFLEGIWENPSILPGLLTSSISTQVGSVFLSEEVLGAGAASAGVGAAAGGTAGLIGGPLAPATSTVGAIGGTTIGFIAGATATMEAALTFSELLHEEIGEPLTKENIRALLEDEERYNDLIKKAIARGVTIGIIEGITGGIAKGVTSKVVKLGFGDRVAAATGLAIEGFGGGLGETGGRIAADQEMDVAEIGFEGIIPGTTTGVVTVFPELNIVKNSFAKLNNTVDNVIVNRELKGTNFTNIESVFEPTTDVSDAAVNLSQSSRAKNYLNKNLDQKVLSGDITQEQAVEVETRYRDIEGAVRKLNKIDVSNNEAVQLLIEKNKLENTIKDVNDNSLTINEKTRVEVINNRLSEITQTSVEEREATVGMGVVPGKRTIPRADQLALEYKENPAEANIEALLDQYNRIGLAAIKFDTRKGDIAREDAVAEINKEFAGIMERWSPDQGALSTFVTANIAPKAQSIYDKYIGKRDVTTLDRQEAREVVAEEVDVEIEPVDTSRPKVYPATLEVITENITPEVRSEQTTMIKDDINRAVATVSTSPKVVAKNLVDQTQTKEYRQLIKNKLGKWNSEQYNNNVDRLVTKEFIATIPVAQIKRRFGKLFNIQQTGTTPTTKIENGYRS